MPMSTIEAVEPAESTVPAVARARLPVSPARALSTGPPITGAISIGEVSRCWKAPVRDTSFGIPG